MSRFENTDNLARLNREIIKHKPLSSEDQDKLLLEYYNTKCPKLRDKIFCCNMRLIMRVINKWNGLFDHNKEEIFSIASIGAINAIENFNPHLGFKLSTLMKKNITNELITYYKQNGSLIRKKSSDFDAIKSGAKQDYSYSSIDSPINDDGDTISDLIGSIDNFDDRMDYISYDDMGLQFWNHIGTKLNVHHYEIIKGLFDKNSRLPDQIPMRDCHIAEMYGVTRQSIGQIKKSIIKKLRKDDKLKLYWSNNSINY